MSKDPELFAHLEWLGYVQPVGLVVSPPALVQAQAHVNRNILPQHQRFLSCLATDEAEEPIPEISRLDQFVQQVLDWQNTDLLTFADAAAHGFDTTALETVLPEYNETLRPTWIVPRFDPNSDTDFNQHAFPEVADPEQSERQKSAAENALPPVQERVQLLIQEVSSDQDLDSPPDEVDRRWNATPHARFERLLRETQIPAGLLFNRRSIRLVYAPRGETSGYLTFQVEEMMTVAGRPIFAALHMLLNADRLFNLEEAQLLPRILAESRKYQNTVSTQLAQQVMAALYDLLRGFQAADDQWNGRLLKDVLAHNPQHVYHGLLTVLMRTVFILYAEDRNLLSNHPVYTNFYSIIGLFERLRSDAGQYPDTMDQRYGAWAQCLTLFRMIYEGGSHAELRIPPRKGYLFDPDRYPFLEGRFDDGDKKAISAQEQNAAVQVPRVPDGVVYRVLNNLLMLDGERLSYRSLDVEQIGSVYEAIMGFEVEVSTGRSIAIKPVKKHGAPATINLEELLKQNATNRAKWLKERTDQDFSGRALEPLKAAKSIEDLLAALDKKIANDVTPNVVPAGAMIFQPSDERRRSGSHYTPRSLTEPIVRTTLEPILKQLVTPFSPASGEKGADRPDEGAHDPLNTAEPQVWQPTAADKKRYTGAEIAERIRLSEKAVEYAKQAREIGTPHPSQILDLKICDPAMGSGAFLVETCRQLGDELIKAWYAHDLLPTNIPPDEDEVLYARRLVAQRCLYGVDKNDMAVDLAKLSLWLVTLAKDHPFTFLDHSLRHGDSLVGLTRRQIIGFHWEPKKQKQFGEDLIQKRLDRATEARAKILNAREDVPYRDQEQRLAVADEALNVVRLTGDACVSAFFGGSKKREREERCDELRGHVEDWYASGHDINKRAPIASAGANLRSRDYSIPPFHWEIEFPEVFSRERSGFDSFVGNPPFVAGRDISGATSREYLDFIKQQFPGAGGQGDLVAYFFRQAFDQLRHAGTFGLIATKTIREGDTRESALAHIRKSKGFIYSATRRYKWPGQAAVTVSVVHVRRGTAFAPVLLDRQQVDVITAFLFHTGPDENPAPLAANDKLCSKGVMVGNIEYTFDDHNADAMPLSEMEQVVSKNAESQRHIFPFLGGDEMLSDPTHAHRRFVADLNFLPDSEMDRIPELAQLIKNRITAARSGTRLAKLEWFKYERPRPLLREIMQNPARVLMHPHPSQFLSFAFIPTSTLISTPHCVFAFDSYAPFASLQNRGHEEWARFFSSSLEDRLRYSPSDCFTNFPMPQNLDARELEDVGREYYEFRANLMIDNNEGLTKTYNRFHDPHEKSAEIEKLRELHAAMDRAVLEAYGWDDLAAAARCEFLLDYEEEEDDQPQGASPGSSRRSKKKKPWRLRWPDDFRDEVLARLLELNEQRHKEELLTGKAGVGGRVSGAGDENEEDEEQEEGVGGQGSGGGAKKAKKSRKSKKTPATGQQEMDF